WTEPVVLEKAPVDEQFDSLFTVTVYGYSYKSFGRGTGTGSGTFAKGQVGTNSVPGLVDPPPAVGRRWTGGGVFPRGGWRGARGVGGKFEWIVRGRHRRRRRRLRPGKLKPDRIGISTTAPSRLSSSPAASVSFSAPASDKGPGRTRVRWVRARSPTCNVTEY